MSRNKVVKATRRKARKDKLARQLFELAAASGEENVNHSKRKG